MSDFFNDAIAFVISILLLCIVIMFLLDDIPNLFF